MLTRLASPVHISSEDSSHLGLEPILRDSLQLNHFFKRFVSNYNHTQIYWGYDFSTWVWGSSPLTIITCVCVKGTTGKWAHEGHQKQAWRLQPDFLETNETVTDKFLFSHHSPAWPCPRGGYDHQVNVRPSLPYLLACRITPVTIYKAKSLVKLTYCKALGRRALAIMHLCALSLLASHKWKQAIQIVLSVPAPQSHS